VAESLEEGAVVAEVKAAGTSEPMLAPALIAPRHPAEAGPLPERRSGRGRHHRDRLGRGDRACPWSHRCTVARCHYQRLAGRVMIAWLKRNGLGRKPARFRLQGAAKSGREGWTPVPPHPPIIQ
jgi:hypothetical protein